MKVAANGPARIRSKKVEYQTPDNPWQRYQIKLLPKQINGKWYTAGDWVYRRWVFGPGGGHWKYGDDFDFMRGK